MSHSTKDIHTVRSVRNELEDMGHLPILFYLKSVSEHSELDELIRREIEARNWFVLCDSENARESLWVQQEREMIRSLPEKVYREVDLSAPLEPQMNVLRELSEAATVFISYRRAISGVARKIYDRLSAAGFRTWMDIPDLKPGQDFSASIRSHVDAAMDEGWVLLLVDSTYFGDRFTGFDLCREEATHALQRNALFGQSRVIPVLLDAPAVALAGAPAEFRALRYVDLHADFDAGMLELVRTMRP